MSHFYLVKAVWLLKTIRRHCYAFVTLVHALMTTNRFSTLLFKWRALGNSFSICYRDSATSCTRTTFSLSTGVARPISHTHRAHVHVHQLGTIDRVDHLCS